MTQDPFAKEMLRIIKLERPGMFGPRTIIIVSFRCHEAIVKETIRLGAVFDAKLQRHDEDVFVILLGCPICPAPWLTDYEFEIRSAPSKFTYPTSLN